MVNNKYTEVVKKAYEQKEMKELYGCRETYSLNENGKYYLNQDIRLTGVSFESSDPINLEALISATEMFYCSLDKKSGEKKRFLDEFTDTLINLIESSDISNLYFATEIYFILGNRENKDIFYPLKGIYKQIKQKLEEKIAERSSELKAEKKYAGRNQDNGLWSVLHGINDIANDEIKILCVE